MIQNRFVKLLILFIFVLGFIATGLYFYNTLVKNNSYKPEEFKNVE